MAVYLEMVRGKWFPPHDPQASFADKTIIITGANVGLGFEAAAKYGSLGASRIILAVRTVSKGEEAKRQIEQRLGDKSPQMEVWQLVMDSYDSIKAFAERASKLDKIDIVVLNAGVNQRLYEESKYGYESTLQINGLSTALLGLLLLPILRKHRKGNDIPVMEIVSSTAHTQVTLTSDEEISNDLLNSWNKNEKGHFGQTQYERSKLLVMCAMKTLAKFAGPPEDPDVIVTAVCPGACRSEIARAYDTPALKLLFQVFILLMCKTTEEGSRVLVNGTLAGKENHGQFLFHDNWMRPVPLLAGSDGQKFISKEWDEIVRALEKDVPDIRQRIAEAQR